MVEAINSIIQQVSLTARSPIATSRTPIGTARDNEISERCDRISQLEDLLAHSKEVKEADDKKID